MIIRDWFSWISIDFYGHSLIFMEFQQCLLIFIVFFSVWWVSIHVHCCSLISIDVHCVFIDFKDCLLFVIYHHSFPKIVHVVYLGSSFFCYWCWLIPINFKCLFMQLYWFSMFLLSFIDVFGFPVFFTDFYIFSSVFIEVLWVSLISINVHHGFLWSFIDSRWCSLIWIGLYWFSLIAIDLHWFSSIF